MSNHTPGPWMVHDYTAGERYNERKDVGPTGLAVCSVIGPFERKWDANSEANAHLIAAAPEQNALLVEALDLVPRISEDDPMAPALADWCRKARAVIDKVTKP